MICAVAYRIDHDNHNSRNFIVILSVAKKPYFELTIICIKDLQADLTGETPVIPLIIRLLRKYLSTVIARSKAQLAVMNPRLRAMTASGTLRLLLCDEAIRVGRSPVARSPDSADVPEMVFSSFMVIPAKEV
jgi:hypothetical protein